VLDSALSHADAALAKYNGRDDEWSWRFRVLKARILVARNQNRAALTVLGSDFPSTLANTDVAEQRKLYVGIAHRNEQQFQDAEKDFAEAEVLARNLAPGLKYQLLVARGDLDVDEKNYARAESNYKSALALARQEKWPPIFEANALGNLGRLAISQEHFDEAIDINQSALQLTRSLGMQGHVATILGNMGSSYFRLGDFENALELYQQGAQASERSGLVGNTTYWFTGVANSYLALHDYSSAEKLATSTLKQARRLNNGQSITQCLNTLAEVMLRTGRLDEAERYNQEAIGLEEKGADYFGVLESLLLSGRIAMNKQHFEEAEILFLRVVQDPKAEMAMKWEVKARLAALQDAEGLTAKAEREYQESIDTIQAARESIDKTDLRLSYLASGIEFYDDYVDFLVRHRRPGDALHVAELSRARTLSEGLSGEGTAPSRPGDRLSPQKTANTLNASLLFYWIGHNCSYLWVISPTKTSYFKLPPASVIDPVVADYRKVLLRMHDAEDEGSAEGKKLYAMLVEPARKLIPPGSQIVVLPSESLYGLNFETLIVPDPQPHFWIEDVTLTTGSSLTMLAASANRPTPKDKTLFLIGDTKPPNPPFAPLPQAAEEMKQVRKYFLGTQTRVLEGGSATPSAFLKGNPEQFSYLHFVTHGTASHTRPLESAVILSQEGDSYKLYARDIVQHRLNANLVTISACNGAGTRAYSGEGLVGLSWAFLRAGAHNVIGALWEVSDASTPQLMDAFYRELFQGKDPATALRNAKLGLLHSADPDSVFKNPFYWAPFQLYAGS